MRSLYQRTSQEVLELYFFPLLRVVGSGGSSTPAPTLTGTAQVNEVIYGKTFYNTDPNNKLTGLLRAFLKGMQIVQTMTHQIKAPTDHVLQQTRSVVYKAPTEHKIQQTRSSSFTLC